MKIRTVTICGGGNGAHVLAALMPVNTGCRVRVFTPFMDEAGRLSEALKAGRCIEVITGAGVIRGAPAVVTADPYEAAAGTDMVILAAPAFAHEAILDALLPHIPEHALIGAMPARCGLELAAHRLLEAHGKSCTVFGFQTLPWACRIREYGRMVEILGLKASVGLASMPGEAVQGLCDWFTKATGTIIYPVGSMLAISLANTGQLIHPGIMHGLFRDYDGRIYTEKEVPLFYQSVDEYTAGVLEAMSAEVQAVKLSLVRYRPELDMSEVLPLKDWLIKSYGDRISDRGSLRACFTTNAGYTGIKAPVKPCGDGGYMPDFSSRYLTEDVPYGLIYTKGVAGLCGVETPAIDGVIEAASRLMQKQYIIGGRLAGSDLGQTRAPLNFEAHDVDTLIKYSTGCY